MMRILTGLMFGLSSVFLHGGIIKINSSLDKFDGQIAVFFCGHVSREKASDLRLETDLGQNHFHEACYCIDPNNEKNPDLCGHILDPEVQEYLKHNGAEKFQFVLVEHPPAIGVLEVPSFLETVYTMLAPGGALVLPIDLPLRTGKDIIFSPCFNGECLAFPVSFNMSSFKAYVDKFNTKLGLYIKADPLTWQTLEDIQAYQSGLYSQLHGSSRFLKTMWPDILLDRLEGKLIPVPAWPFLPLLQRSFYAKYFETLKSLGFIPMLNYHDINQPDYIEILCSYAAAAKIPAKCFKMRIGCFSGLLCLSCKCGCEQLSLFSNGLFKTMTLRCIKPF